VTRIPIACSLTAPEAVDRGGEWQQFLSGHVSEVVRDGPSVRLHLAAGDKSLLTAVDLAEREKACCAFFTFTVELDGGGRWLRVTAPDEAAEILDTLFTDA